MNINKIKDIYHNCSICNYNWSLVYQGRDLFDNNGNKIYFRKSCPNCNWTKKLTSEEIDLIVKSAK